jgi:hypothetical protein
MLLGKIINLTSIIELVVTDEEPAPWLVFTGPASDILELISGQRYFEYMITDHSHAWIAFDTHHNELVLCGSIKELAEATL